MSLRKRVFIHHRAPRAGLLCAAALCSTVAAGLALRSSPARACSCLPRPGAGKLYLGDDGALPVDAVGIPYVGALERPDGAGQITLEREREPGTNKFKRVTYSLERSDGALLIVPSGGLELGVRYRVRVRASARDLELLKRFRQDDGSYPPSVDPPELEAIATRVDEPLPGAEDGVTLRAGEGVRGELRVAAGAMCSATIEARSVDITAELAPALARFRGYLLFETYVDGDRWGPWEGLCDAPHLGRSWRSHSAPPGDDRVFTSCEPPPEPGSIRPQDQANQGLGEGEHTVRVDARAPDGRLVLSSASIAVQLRCEDAPAVEPAAPGSLEPATSEPLASTPASDTSEEPPPIPPSRSRGCAVARAPRGLWWTVSLALLLFAPPRSRKRSR